MNSFETKRNKTTREKLAEVEKQKAVFAVNDKRSGEKYEVVMDESGKKQVLNREKKLAELENKIRKSEKQELAKKLSQEKDDLIREIKELENEFKKPGIKSKKALIERNILEKEAKVKELENQLRPTKKEKKDKKEGLPQSDQLDQSKPEAVNAKKKEKKTKEKEVDLDNNPMIKSEGGEDVSAQKTEVKEEVNWDESDVIKAEKGWDSKKEGANETLVKKAETGIEEERKQNIEKLWQEVESHRKTYLEADYKNNKAISRLKKFFGSFLKRNEEGANYESDKDLAHDRANYDNALLKHKKAVLNEARLKGASGKELLDIAKFYQVEANVNLADVHDQVKIENEGSIFIFINKNSKELVERYKKMPLAKKIAIGAAFGLAGAGSIYFGGAAVGIAGSAIAARRAIMGVITGTTVSLGFEAKGKKKTAEKIQKEMEKLEKKMTGLSEEEKNKMLEGFIDKDIWDEDQKINKIKNKNLRHLAYGVAAGLGTVLAPKITRLFSEGTDVGSSALKQSGIQNIPVNESEMPERLGLTDKEIAEKLKFKDTAPETAPVAATEELATPEVEQVIAEVQKGDSLWKIIDKQLENHDGYVELNEAQKTYVIDALKDKVAIDPEKFGLDNIDKLKIGQKIDLSELFQDKQPENLIIGAQDLNEGQMQDILDNNEKLRDWVKTNPEEMLTSEKTAEILTEKVSEPERLGMTDEEILAEESKGSEKSDITDEEIKKILEAEEISKNSEEPVVENNTDASEQAEKSAAKEEPEIKFEKAAEEPEATLSAEEAHKIIEKSVDKFGENIISSDTLSLSDGQRAVSWEEIKDVKCSDIRLGESAAAPEYVKSRLDKIMFFSEESFGAEGIANPKETLREWLMRLTEKYGADKMENIFKLAQ